MIFFKSGDEFKHNTSTMHVFAVSMKYELNKLKMNTLVAGTKISYLENTIRVGSERVKRTSSGALSVQRTHKDTFSLFQSCTRRNVQLFN